MNFAKTRQLTFAVALLAAPAAMAQQTAPPQAEPPSATQPAPEAPATPRMTERAQPASSALLGKDVFSSDQTRLGKVEKVISGQDGKATAIHIKTGGFLGFGGKMVAIPESKFSLRGDNVQVQMTAEDVSKLPEEKDQS